MQAFKGRGDTHSKEELDTSNLINPEDASKRFRNAEKRTVRPRIVYSYPESPTGSTSALDATGDATKPLPLSQRLRTLQLELASLEQELADPTNPLIQKEREELNVDPGELIRGLVDVRGRLNKILKEKEGRARLVDTILHDGPEKEEKELKPPGVSVSDDVKEASPKPQDHSLLDVDRRVEELEKLLGSSNAGLDESSPLPPPLLPMITKLNNQLALLTQPRHIDSISRRLKILLSDLERASAAQQHRKQGSQGAAPVMSAYAQEQLLNTVNRIAPSLPQIPHILARLRTLSSLHSAAGEFQDTLNDLEQEQRKVRASLVELQTAVDTVEKSLEENRKVVKGNVTGLDARVEGLLKRVEGIQNEERMYQSQASA
ncbi:hypothetical protein CC1G_07394 [Coprinopsis cinerea okayama7|uniref:Dynactin 2 n=1 Tax=Coprinopsis cinerea (strain Okayama-7 / 130 / ATCC MYA-4618 / FGSC 9003) TaxID=240176 RepID=A8N6M3_COPC7|nr:hypothetical protein CC1G_07394 [Coprinopsis cinerea okayama7\|eukprot:XP_001830479.2 hypothetical protein CC1G_07394 [Coprinopsis cinerea okayama7\